MNIIDELVLIEKIKERNEKAFEILIKNYKNYIYTICFGIIKNHEDALDISQEVFIKVYFSIGTYKNEGFKTWISKLAVNLSIDYLRKRKKSSNDISIEDHEDNLKLATEDVEQKVIKIMDEEKLHLYYNSLPKKYSIILKKYYFESKSYSLISMEENISIKTVETRLYRAKKMLKEKWGSDLYEMF